MLNQMNSKARVLAVVVFMALLLAVGVVTAHAQVFCTQVQAHPLGDIVTLWGPYGPYTTIVPCTHWITVCN